MADGRYLIFKVQKSARAIATKFGTVTLSIRYDTVN